MRVNNTVRTITDSFLRKRCRDSPYQTSAVLFSKVYLRFFFFLRALQLTGVRL